MVTKRATLVIGGLEPEAEDEALATAARNQARLVRPLPATAVGLPGYQRTNFAVACAAAGALIGELDERAVAEAIAHSEVPGRLQRVAERPLTIVDGAHNPSGVAALAAALPDAVGERPVVAVISILDDKDAAGMLRELLPHCAAAVFTRSLNPRALPAATLASLASQLGGAGGGGPLEIDPDPYHARGARPGAGRARPAPSWRPARSTSSPTCSAPPEGGGARARRCERPAAQRR